MKTFDLLHLPGAFGHHRRVLPKVCVLVCLVTTARLASATPPPKLALLLVAHGAPRESWNVPVRGLADQVKSALTKNSPAPFSRVEPAFLEFARPSVAQSLRRFQAEGVTRVVVLPLFVAPSGHTCFDLPAVLGFNLDPSTLNDLRKEEVEIYRGPLPTSVGPPLSQGSFLDSALVRQTRQLSSKPDSEAVVILAHGDSRFAPIWQKRFQRLGATICASTGISYFDVAFVEVGQGFLQNGVAAIQRAAGFRPTVLVVGAYLSLSPKHLAQRFADRLWGKGGELEGLRVRFSDRALVDDPEISQQVAALARMLAIRLLEHPPARVGSPN